MMHGGGAPQVKASARERLAALIDPAIDRLYGLVRGKHPSVALGAVRDVLDRAGLKAPDKAEVSVSGFKAETLGRVTDDELAIVLEALDIQLRAHEPFSPEAAHVPLTLIPVVLLTDEAYQVSLAARLVDGTLDSRFKDALIGEARSTGRGETVCARWAARILFLATQE